jgi:dihydroxy-acid dehydratase
VRFDLRAGTADIVVPEEELEQRRKELAAEPYPVPDSQTPWQEIQRSMVGQMSTGMVLEPAVAYQRVAQNKGVPRHSH